MMVTDAKKSYAYELREVRATAELRLRRALLLLGIALVIAGILRFHGLC